MPKTSSKARSDRKAKSWKDVEQGVKPRQMSAVAWKRQMAARLKWMGLCVAAALAAVGLYRAFQSDAPSALLLSRASESRPIETFEAQSDGFLDRDWAVETLGLRRGQDLLSIDLAALKSRLEAFGQVRRAEVERQFPDRLFISIEERRPVVRLLAQRRAGERLLLLVDAEGVAYEPIDVPTERIRQLPFLDGVRLRRAADGYEPIQGMDAVAELLGQARSLAPHLYRNWRVVSLEPAPNVLVKSLRVRQALFEPRDYRRQLARLDYIVDYHSRRALGPIGELDLTLERQAPARPIAGIQ